jgi:hypothetical protein
VATQVWPGDAVVHVSIVNWIKGRDGGEKTLAQQMGDGVDAPWESYRLPAINAALSPRADLTTARDIAANLDPKTTFQGQTPGHRDGFVVSPALAERWIRDDAANAEVLFAYLVGDDLLDNPDSSPSRVLLDFGDRDLGAARRYREPFEHVERLVLGAREAAAREEAGRNAEVRAGDPEVRVNRHHAAFLRRWWRLSFRREDMLEALAKLGRYIALSRVTRRPVFEFVPASVRPGDALQVFALDDDYSFGVLQSDVHWQWFKERCSGLKIDPRYTSRSVYGTFPWPQKATPEQVCAVGAAGRALRELRRSILEKDRIGLRSLYGLLERPGAHPLADAHRRLDDAVRAAYGMTGGADPLAHLLDLNHALAASETSGKSVVGPGPPPSVSDRRVARCNPMPDHGTLGVMASRSTAAVVAPAPVIERAPAARAPAGPSREAWLASQLSDLTPEERAAYDRGAFFHDLVDLVIEEEWNAPGRFARARETEERLRALYGGDADRELADLEAGRHPLQLPR